MNASTTPMAPPGAMARPPRQARPGAVTVPARWRIWQGLALLLVVALAVFYNTTGWKSSPPSGGDSRTLADQLGFVVLAGMIWLTSPTAGIIALTTFQEALRRRWMAALLLFAVVVLAALGGFANSFQPGEEERFLRDFGIGFIILITLLMSIFLGVALVPPEIDRRIILTILAKPVNRLEFLLGKFLGLCATLLLNVLILGSVFLLTYAVFKIRREGWAGAWVYNEAASHLGLGFSLRQICSALLLHTGQLTVLAALSLMLSLIVSHITAIVFCFIAYFGGQMSSYWEHLGAGEHTASGDAPGLSKPMQGILNALYYALPRLDRFDVRAQLVNETPVLFNYVWKAFGSGLVYSAILLLIGYLVFSDREF